MGNYCILNGINSNELTGLLVSSLPPISKPLMRTQIETIDGRDGDIVTNLGYSAYDKKMEIGLYGDYDIDEIIAFFASEGTVTFSNEADKYYLYTIVDQIDFDRLVRYRTATVTFHVQPYKYDATETEIDYTNSTTEDTVPYIFRASPQDGASIMKLKKVVGGTIAWNQIQDTPTSLSGSVAGVTASVSNGVVTITGPATASGTISVTPTIFYGTAIPANHVILICATGKGNIRLARAGFGAGDQQNYVFSKHSSAFYCRVQFYVDSGKTYDCEKRVQVFDLTQMFGSTIADYIYSLETANTGDGVAWFKALFGEDYYPPNGGELLSVKTSARKTYNADNVEIGSYALDDNLTLRGIPKLDGNNNLYYDGDTYASDGTVTRKYGTITFDGSSDESWTVVAYGTNGYYRAVISVNGIATTTPDASIGNIICNQFEPIPYTTGAIKTGVTCRSGYAQLNFFQTAITSVADWRTWLSNNPVTVVYELATSTTESADAYTESQRVGATEEFVDGRTVEMPVGHNSIYYAGTPITVVNDGNVPSKPIMTIYATGDITLSLNGDQIFNISMGDCEYIVIDTNNMEAYMGGVLLNRQVTGDYSSFALQVGENTITFGGTGIVTEVIIENYSRWI